MKKLGIGIVFASLFAFGCGGGGGVGDLEKLKDEACACKDKACAEAVNKKMDAEMEKLEKSYGGKEPDEATQKKLMGIMLEAGECLAKNMK